MKYSILGFNQKKIVEYVITDNKSELRCDLTDLLLLNYLIYAQSNVNMKHILDDKKQPCVWLQHKHILEDLPILNITEGTLKNRLIKLRKMNLIDSVTVANENTQGTRTYYKTTSFLSDLLFETTSLKNDVLDEPRHFKMTSNKSTNSNNKKVICNNSKELLQGFDFGVKKEKPPKQNLYSKCVALIYAKTDNDIMRKLFIQWLDMLLEKYKGRDKVLYANIFKGKLNTIDKYDKKDWKDIIEYNLQRGYEAFYPIPIASYSKQSYNQLDRPWEDGVTSIKATKAEEDEREKWLEEQRAKGIKVDF